MYLTTSGLELSRQCCIATYHCLPRSKGTSLWPSFQVIFEGLGWWVLSGEGRFYHYGHNQAQALASNIRSMLLLIYEPQINFFLFHPTTFGNYLSRMTLCERSRWNCRLSSYNYICVPHPRMGSVSAIMISLSVRPRAAHCLVSFAVLPAIFLRRLSIANIG